MGSAFGANYAAVRLIGGVAISAVTEASALTYGLNKVVMWRGGGRRGNFRGEERKGDEMNDRTWRGGNMIMRGHG